MLSRGISRFSFDFFDLAVLKNFVGNAFNLPEIFGYRNFLCMRTENHVLQSKIFVSQYAKNSWEPPLSFRIFGISEIFMRITVFLRFFLSHSTKKFREEPSNVSKSFKCEVSEKNFEWERDITIFRRKFFGSEFRKILVVENFGVSEKFGYRKFSCLRGWYHFPPLNFFTYAACKAR